MTQLDFRHKDDIAEELVSILVDQGGYSAEEAIPGLIEAVVRFCKTSQSLFVQAQDMLADYEDMVYSDTDNYDDDDGA